MTRIHDERAAERAAIEKHYSKPVKRTFPVAVVAPYSLLNDRKQIFASKYLPNLPTEEQLRREIERERRLIEAWLEEKA